MSDPIDLGESTLADGYKNLLIEVPDFDDTRAGNQVSYVRLGQFSPADATESRGHALLAKAKQAGLRQGDTRERVFEDDWRTRDSTDPQDPVRSGELLASGKTAGWRDHTSGDRVTTTRCDKVEVIGGNYKLVVLGHQSDPHLASGLDLSGGHYQPFHRYPGTTTEMKYENGGWAAYAKTDGIDKHSVYSGPLLEEYFGTIKTVIGGGPPAPPHGDNLKLSAYGNPKITEHTRATAITEETTCAETYSTKLKSSTIESAVTTGVYLEVVAGPLHMVTDDSALIVELFLGNYVSVQVGAFIELFIGARLELEANKFDTKELFVAGAATITPAAGNTAASEAQTAGEQKLDALKATFTTLKSDISAVSASYDALTTAQSGITRSVTALADNISALKVRYSAKKTDLGL